jgi:hypothetical protein
MHILKQIFEDAKEREVMWVMKEGGIMCVMKKMRDKRERDDSVSRKRIETLHKITMRWKFRMENKGKREKAWMVESEGVIETIVCLGRDESDWMAWEMMKVLGV